MENQLMALPQEVQDIAIKVSKEKQDEVNNVLNQIFTGTNDWDKQVDSIEVKGINDVMSIRMADTARKNVKTARLSAEKIFDAKRLKVQTRMQDDKLEDSLWLKAKQIMQLKFKSIEEKAEWKANYVQRYEAEQKELRTQLRIEKVAKFNPELNRLEFENMSNEMFDIFLSGIEKSFNDKIEAEKKAEESRIAKEKADIEERERIKAENERLRKEAEEKEKALEVERKKQVEILAKQKKEAEMIAKIEAEKQAKILEEEKAKADKEKAIADAKLKAEMEEKARLQSELRAKEKAEEEAKAKADKAEKDRIEAEKKAAKAPDKEKLIKWVDSFLILEIDNLKSVESNEIADSIICKFNAFKNWAKTQTENI